MPLSALWPPFTKFDTLFGTDVSIESGMGNYGGQPSAWSTNGAPGTDAAYGGLLIESSGIFRGGIGFTVKSNTSPSESTGMWMRGGLIKDFNQVGLQIQTNQYNVAGGLPYALICEHATAQNACLIGWSSETGNASPVANMKWQLGFGSTGGFTLNDLTANIARINVQTASFTEIDGSGSNGHVLFNMNTAAGTGGAQFGNGSSGGGTPTLEISGTGNIRTNTASNRDLAGQCTATGGTCGTITFTDTYTTNPPICVATDASAIEPTRVQVTTTTLIITGTSGDVIDYICIGRT